MTIRRAPTLVLVMAGLLAGCFPSFEGLSSGGGGGSGTSDSGTGGSGGGGQSGIMDGAAEVDGAAEGDTAHQVLGCALGKIGEWQLITPPQVDLTCDSCGTRALVVDPQNAGTLYLSVVHQGLWKSSDCGQTWSMANVGRNGILVGASDLPQLEIDPVDSRTLYTRGEDKEFKSTDGGTNWDIIWPTNPLLAQASLRVDSVAIDPSDHQHLLIDFREACTAEYAPSCIAESRDAGASWSLLKTPGGAGGRARPWFIDSTHWLLAQGGGLWRSADSGATWQTLADSGIVDVRGRMYRAVGGGFYLGSSARVLFSPDGAVWSLIAETGEFSYAGVVGDGTTIYSSGFGVCFDYGTDLMPYATAPEGKDRPWTTLPSPTMTQGAYDLGYDRDHHVLYSSNCNRGFWRVVTR